MSYYATGSGSIQFNNRLDEKTIMSIEEKLDECGMDFYNSYDKKLKNGDCESKVTVIECSNDSNYLGDDEVKEILDEIRDVSQIDSGEIEYVGEDGSHWRFIFKNGEWEMQPGTVKYDESGFGNDDKIYTHDEAAKIVDIFENVLGNAEIVIPSPEDDERESNNQACLYGSVYSNILDSVENSLADLLKRSRNGADIIPDVFSGDY